MSNEGLSGTIASTMNAKKLFEKTLMHKWETIRNHFYRIYATGCRSVKQYWDYAIKEILIKKMLMEGNKDRVLISLICNTEIFRSALQILWLDGDLYLQSRLRKQIRLIDCNLQWRTQYHFQWQHFLHTGKRKLCI